VEELKSARLIIELLQQESSTKITSNQDDINRNNISYVTSNQAINVDWVEVSSKCCGETNKDKDKPFLNKAPFMENVQLTLSNQYSIFKEDNIEEEIMLSKIIYMIEISLLI
jgi:hypothetical protein